MKHRVRDHIVWKSEPVWRLRLKQYAGEESNQGGNTQLKVLKEMIEFRVPIEVVDAILAEHLSEEVP